MNQSVSELRLTTAFLVPLQDSFGGSLIQVLCGSCTVHGDSQHTSRMGHRSSGFS